MKEIILITGANGMVAKKLSERLSPNFEIRFLSRNPKRENEYLWNIEKKYLDENALKNVTTIIHLAGANISEKRWTKARKEEIISSRVDSAKLVLDSLKKNSIKIKAFISASAVGFYGTITSEHIFSEIDEKGNDFLSDVVYLWENIADRFLEDQVANRVVKVRTGVVLSTKEGALAKMLTPIKLGIGSALGSGKQYIPWIHIDDLVNIYKFAIEKASLNGAYNACSPEHINNYQLMKLLAENLEKPFFFPKVPAFLLKLIFGEMSSVVLEGSRCSSEKIVNDGFIFDYKSIKNSIKNLLIQER